MTSDCNSKLSVLLDLMPAALVDQLVSEAMVRNPRFAAWRVEEAARRQTAAERAETEEWVERGARRFVARLRARKVAACLRELPREPMYAPVSGVARQILRPSVAEHCAPLAGMPVAAGVGYELWDDVIDTWLKLPEDVPRGEYLAIPVRGDSMEPVLHDGDTVLVKLGARAVPGSVVIARTADEGYVVKYVEGRTNGGLQLASLNPDYPSVVAAADPAAVLGTVIARFAREET